MDRQIIKTLKALGKSSENFGRSDAELEKIKLDGWARIAERIGADPVLKPAVYTWREYAQYYTWNFTHGILLPAAAGFAMVLFVIGGWITTAAAAAGALPGDPLYGFKLSSEKLQIVVTWNAEKRADLQLAFASRRLEEMAVLNALQSENKAERVQVAVNGFKSQVNSVTTTLQELSEQKSQASVARAVDQATQTYKEAIAEQDEQTAAAVESEVDSASEAAVEVIMSNAEANAEDTQAAQEARESFDAKRVVFDTRIKIALGRIAVEREATASLELDAQTEELMALSEALQKAEDLLETGAYRTAFAELTVIEDALEALEVVDTQEGLE